LARGYVENMTAAKPLSDGELLRRAGYAGSTALKASGAVLSSVGVQRAIREAMVEAGITPEVLAAKHRELLEAMNADGSPAHGTQLRALELAYRVLGGFQPANEIQPSIMQLSVNILNAPDSWGKSVEACEASACSSS
jgi:hypothetical protein